MGFKRRPPKVFLLATPKGPAPLWWPRNEAGKPREVVVTDEGGGWSLIGSRRNRIHAHEQQDIGEIFEMIMLDRKFRFRTVTTCENQGAS